MTKIEGIEAILFADMVIRMKQNCKEINLFT